MTDDFDIFSIYEQNLNFLFGAGASYGFLPTLALKIKDEQNNSCTFETLAKRFEDERKDNLLALLFMHYYRECIYTGLPRIPKVPFPPHRIAVLDQYKKFIKTLLVILDKQGRSAKKANIYTTNYDDCIEMASEELLTSQSYNFVVSDGSAGFQSRTFHTKNFNHRVIQKGIFDKHDEYVPQLNLLHLHGSVYWRKVASGIGVDYGQSNYDIAFNEIQSSLLEKFSSILNNDTNTVDGLEPFEQFQDWNDFSTDDFWENYKQIPIVNPTKWKFHETVFEEAYYQILRHLSYELERPNSVLITFGFSFADEHILHLIQRSLSNPSLTLYVSCFNAFEKQVMKRKFNGYKNVKYICIDDELTFTRFNNRIFTLKAVDK